MSYIFLCIEGEVIKCEESSSYPGTYMTPYGFCRRINGTKCSCCRAETLEDGSCPCAPRSHDNPMCKRMGE
jgi:hypothetical protein